ncbi:hypothetical protein BDK51DRAFT_45736 [Blyttiomyces helicus]|uniref:3-hydroxyacyl-CoA dehydrogenase NAD binding domain-containing protein n=1 Tax=Blyttiomyces helicus TaxID=388810 RepID=A0A4P9W961_9FUNG|nr:hypothetical protein BDK51DRAFT_45736 [Blyttiomyces helicus]|eukprot:RKO86736.1 hypothetical protein BDK51DRAFT_45736 [Blyttiomyces helicus]
MLLPWRCLSKCYRLGTSYTVRPHPPSRVPLPHPASRSFTSTPTPLQASIPPTLPRSTYKAPTTLTGRPLTVVGAGTLGRRIALAWLTRGGIVHLVDVRPSQLADAGEFVEAEIGRLLRHVEGASRGSLRTFEGGLEDAVAGAWCVIEAVPEKLDLKTDILCQLDKMLPTDCIIATTSSSFLSRQVTTPSSPAPPLEAQSFFAWSNRRRIREKISDVLANVAHPERVICTHYHVTPDKIPVEVMPNKHTDSRVAPLLIREAARHGIEPVYLKKESAGLIYDRIEAAINREALSIVAEGVAEPIHVDSIMKALGHRTGAFEKLDRVGLDVALDIERRYANARGGHLSPEPANLLQGYVDSVRLGEKSGAGFFIHAKDDPRSNPDRLVYLDFLNGRIVSCNAAGGDPKIIVSDQSLPDGVAVDQRRGGSVLCCEKIYWTNMGSLTENNGTIQSCDLNGTNIQTIVPPGMTHTPKQLRLDTTNDKLYWCDREGMRVMRCNLDGTHIETLVQPGDFRVADNPHAHCVGIALDLTRGLVYWTQKGAMKEGAGRILRAPIELREGETPSTRSDIQTLFHSLPEPVDLALDETTQTIYWTDRGAPPLGQTLNCASVADAFYEPRTAEKGWVVADGLHEVIGLALDVEKCRAYVTNLMGDLYVVDLRDGRRTLLKAGGTHLTGVTFVKGGGWEGLV